VVSINAEIITSGRELLIGKTVNTNASWIASQLTSVGVNVVRITAVGDSIGEISKVITESVARKPSFIIITGGLGPTYDDLTAEGLASALKLPRGVNHDALEQVTKKYASMGMQVTPARRKMAILPEGSQPIRNDIGTAPGIIMYYNGTLVFCLPGVPKEMTAMFSSYITKVIGACAHTSFVERSFITEGVAESALAPAIDDWRQLHPGIYIKSHPRGTESVPTLEIHLSVTGNDPVALAQSLIDAEESFTSFVVKLGGRTRGCIV
jgi:molybdenum cofactor synthesis domain-containing protein